MDEENRIWHKLRRGKTPEEIIADGHVPKAVYRMYKDFKWKLEVQRNQVQELSDKLESKVSEKRDAPEPPVARTQYFDCPFCDRTAFDMIRFKNHMVNSHRIREFNSLSYDELATIKGKLEAVIQRVSEHGQS